MQSLSKFQRPFWKDWKFDPKIQWGKEYPFQHMVLAQLDIHMNKVGSPYLTPYTKVNTKGIKDLSLRAKTIQILGENIDLNQHGFRLNNYFFHMTWKAQARKEKVDKLAIIQIKNSCYSEITIKKVKSQTNECKKCKLYLIRV